MENKYDNQENKKNDLSKEDIEDVAAGEVKSSGFGFPCDGPGR